MQLILPILFYSLFALALFGIARVVFYYRYSQKNARQDYKKDLFNTHIMGTRFDLKNIASSNYFPLLLAVISFFIPATNHTAYIVCLIYYFLVTVVFLTLIIADYFFYSYFSDRLNYLIWGIIDDDIKALLITIWKDYNVVAYLLAIVLVLLVVYGILKLLFLSAFAFFYTSTVSFMAVWITILVFNVIFTRGTLRHMPLSVKHAYVSKHAFLNALCNNPVTLMYYMMKIRRKNKQNKAFETPFHQNFEKIKETLAPKNHDNTIESMFLKRSTKLEHQTRPHVVVFMMESFGSQFLVEDKEAWNLLGCLKKHFEEDHIFFNFLSDANGTAESFASLVANMMMQPFSNALTESKYLNRQLTSSVSKLYQKEGYDTVAVYGGLLSWRNIGKFLSIQGFTHVKGQQDIIDELKLTQDIGNEWGVYDEYLISYVQKHLERATRPQFIFVLSTTNHPPFSMPQSFHFEHESLAHKYQERFLRSDESLKRFKVFNYCNEHLGQFIADIKKHETLAQNTLIAITGDHAYRGYKTSEQDTFLKSAVPFYLYAPKAYTHQYPDINYMKFGSHKDIMPTLIELSLSECAYFGLGNNMLINNDKGIAFNSTGMAANQYGLVLLGAQPGFYAFSNGVYTTPSSENTELKQLLNTYYASIDATSLFLQSDN